MGLVQSRPELLELPFKAEALKDCLSSLRWIFPMMLLRGCLMWKEDGCLCEVLDRPVQCCCIDTLLNFYVSFCFYIHFIIKEGCRRWRKGRYVQLQSKIDYLSARTLDQFAHYLTKKQRWVFLKNWKVKLRKLFFHATIERSHFLKQSEYVDLYKNAS